MTIKREEECRNPIAGQSPITIGGGGDLEKKNSTNIDSVYIAFNHNDYVQNGTGPYKNEEDSLESLTITGAEPPDVSNAEEIVITCLNPDSKKTAKIIIEAKPLGVSFKSNDFPYDQASQTHTSTKSNKPRVITSVKVDGEEVLPDPHGNIVTIVANNVGRRGLDVKGKFDSIPD